MSARSQPVASQRDQWIGAKEAAELLGLDKRTVKAHALKMGVIVREYPGVCSPKFFREDVQRVAREAIHGAAGDDQAGRDEPPGPHATPSDPPRKNEAARNHPEG